MPNFRHVGQAQGSSDCGYFCSWVVNLARRTQARPRPTWSAMEMTAEEVLAARDSYCGGSPYALSTNEIPAFLRAPPIRMSTYEAFHIQADREHVTPADLQRMLDAVFGATFAQNFGTIVPMTARRTRGPEAGTCSRIGHVVVAWPGDATHYWVYDPWPPLDGGNDHLNQVSKADFTARAAQECCNRALVFPYVSPSRLRELRSP